MKSRIPETDHGIQGTAVVDTYDQLQRDQRDRGHIKTQAVIQSGIRAGEVLEIGFGPGYLGLEWLKATAGTRLTGLDISPDMVALAQKNAAQYGLSERVHYDLGCGDALPYEDDRFEAVFTNGSLHEWKNPKGTFTEIYRVLKLGGRFFVSDLRRDMSFFLRGYLWLGIRQPSIRPYMLSSINAAYTAHELEEILAVTKCAGAEIKTDPVCIMVSGQKGSVN